MDSFVPSNRLEQVFRAMAGNTKTRANPTEKQLSAFSQSLQSLMADRGMTNNALAEALGKQGYDITELRISDLRTRAPKKPGASTRPEDLAAIAEFFGRSVTSMYSTSDSNPSPSEPTSEQPSSETAELLDMAKEALDGPKRKFLAEAISLSYAAKKTRVDYYSS